MPATRGFPKSARLSDNTVFVELLKGRRKASGCLEIGTRASDAGPRIGIVVGKKNLGRAVERNALKRIVREAFRHARPELPPRDILIRLRQRLKGVPRQVWKADVARAVRILLDDTRSAAR